MCVALSINEFPNCSVRFWSSYDYPFIIISNVLYGISPGTRSDTDLALPALYTKVAVQQVHTTQTWGNKKGNLLTAKKKSYFINIWKKLHSSWKHLFRCMSLNNHILWGERYTEIEEKIKHYKPLTFLKSQYRHFFLPHCFKKKGKKAALVS